MQVNQPSPEILAKLSDRDLKNADLNNCDREPIHISNAIQPQGILLAVSAVDWSIFQVSSNTEAILGIVPQELLNQPLQDLLGEAQVKAIQDCLAGDFEQINPLPIAIQRAQTSLLFDGIVHRQGQVVVVELETTTANNQGNFFDFYRLVKSPIDRIQRTSNFGELCDAIATEVKKITGFDRVMIYRFAGDGSGEVIAEAVSEHVESFLGLHYPATDIPKQAKYLYTLNFLRLIADVGYQPVAITPELNPLTNEPLDLSMSVLRSVSPIHTEYLGNMGVGASMSISLLKDRQLWGLIACHHESPRQVPYTVRTICEFIGQIASFEIAAKAGSQDADYKIKLQSIQQQLIATISQAEDLAAGLQAQPQQLLDSVGATGTALCCNEEITLIGNTPSPEFIRQMLPWLESQFTEEIIYTTNSLGEVYQPEPKATQTSTTNATDRTNSATPAAGLLALLIAKIPKTFVIWFRPEIIQTVDWGGNPTKPQTVTETGETIISPRKSFAKWQETVRGKSLPWKNCEVISALELRSAIVGIILRKADELAQVNQELTRSNVELDAFAYIASHDLKEPLRGIYNYSSFLLEDYQDIFDEAGKDKLNTLMRLTHRMEDLINSLLHYSRLGRAELQINTVDLNRLIAGVLDVIQASGRGQEVEFIIPRDLPLIKCDRTQINELFTNLISNGIKYNQQQNKVIEIGYLDQDDPVAIARRQEFPHQQEPKTIFYVRDNGIGIRERHLDSIFRIFKRLHGQKKYGGGTGAGLTIAKKIVERHGGEIWVKSVYQQGSVFYFTLQ